jgi:Tol biopolymer transport system component
MRRRLVALSAALVVAAGAAPVSAADPDEPWSPSWTPPRRERVDETWTHPQTAPGAPGAIVYVNSVFSLDLSEPGRLRSIGPGGGDPQPLTGGGFGGAGDQQPAYSPGGTMIVWSRDTTPDDPFDDAGDLYLMDADGSNIRRLTNTTAAEYTPTFSPDGARIAFSANRANADNFDIYSMNLDGSDLRRLTSDPAIDYDPSWSPDGTQIAFVSDRAGNPEIYRMNTSGGGLYRVTIDARFDLEPSWSPDGARIAFSSNRVNAAAYDIWRVQPNRENLTRVTVNSDESEFAPSWSPDGGMIAFTSDHFGDWDIFTIPWTGGGMQLVTTSFDDDHSPDWQPQPDFALVDARFSSFEPQIVWAYTEGIASGCSAERYCPNDPVTRGQMATFLSRALDLPATTEDFFTDDETSTHETSINRVAAAGIASGCTATTFCPNATVTREQMATFLARALELPATDEDFFTDDETSTHEISINRVAAAGIASGCTATTFCPKAAVTRGQMAAFLFRALAD